MQALGGDADLAAEAELPAVREARGGVPIDGGAFHAEEKTLRTLPVLGDDGVAVACGVRGDVGDGSLQVGTTATARI